MFELFSGLQKAVLSKSDACGKCLSNVNEGVLEDVGLLSVIIDVKMVDS